MPVRALTRLLVVEPIVPTTRPQPFDGRGWLFEPKYDASGNVLPQSSELRALLPDCSADQRQTPRQASPTEKEAIAALGPWRLRSLPIPETGASSGRAGLVGRVLQVVDHFRVAARRWKPDTNTGRRSGAARQCARPRTHRGAQAACGRHSSTIRRTLHQLLRPFGDRAARLTPAGVATGSRP
jgi:hypothetical protein